MEREGYYFSEIEDIITMFMDAVDFCEKDVHDTRFPIGYIGD